MYAARPSVLHNAPWKASFTLSVCSTVPVLALMTSTRTGGPSLARTGPAITSRRLPSGETAIPVGNEPSGVIRPTGSTVWPVGRTTEGPAASAGRGPITARDRASTGRARMKRRCMEFLPESLVPARGRRGCCDERSQTRVRRGLRTYEAAGKERRGGAPRCATLVAAASGSSSGG
jgi:hypothetical protein